MHPRPRQKSTEANRPRLHLPGSTKPFRNSVLQFWTRSELVLAVAKTLFLGLIAPPRCNSRYRAPRARDSSSLRSELPSP
eukprot:3968667-Lingulodinium_polyedra.AAC.1